MRFKSHACSSEVRADEDLAIAKVEGEVDALAGFESEQFGRVTRWTWNEDRQPTSHTDAEGHVWQLEWNAKRQLISTTDPAGNTTRFEYDERGR
nr:RHS repeat domain-containing protein [Burkholderia aenigmatica]